MLIFFYLYFIWRTDLSLGGLNCVHQVAMLFVSDKIPPFIAETGSKMVCCLLRCYSFDIVMKIKQVILIFGLLKVNVKIFV